ncbi:AtpZ/AtpI family protein [Sphingobacterium alkalisoli]|uniref:AtpZ/AtpI family protein n=1 Tax=Sphingobacterium alkalisoli TaxID=1874115 RepID=UPI001E56F0EB|nr:AtpZ/AtpI family protein [Sphingobacterium alkalisoli]
MDNKIRDPFSKLVADKEKRKLKALRSKGNIWSGLGMMGMVGWSVVVPALLGTLGGLWLDKRVPQSFSWTLTLLFAGLIFGSVIAWYWVDKEEREIGRDHDKEIKDDE